MDILTHTLSGVAAGTVVAGFSDKSSRNKLGITAIAGFGAMLPDLDAISLWSGFDSTFGKLFGLDNPGKIIYSSKFWYSHHGFLHSVFAGFLIVIVFTLLIYLIKSKANKLKLSQFVKSKKLFPISFILGFIIHLLQDMPTPSSAWGGVNFFWPSKSYIGGTGDIWWWNNYDIFLLALAVIALNGLIYAFKKVIKISIRKLTITVFLLGFILTIIQIKTRKFDFNYIGHTSKYAEFEKKSREIQKQILGNRIYDLMTYFDNKIPINF